LSIFGHPQFLILATPMPLPPYFTTDLRHWRWGRCTPVFRHDGSFCGCMRVYTVVYRSWCIDVVGGVRCRTADAAPCLFRPTAAWRRERRRRAEKTTACLLRLLLFTRTTVDPLRRRQLPLPMPFNRWRCRWTVNTHLPVSSCVYVVILECVRMIFPQAYFRKTKLGCQKK